MFDRIEFLFSEALIALRRNTWMTFAAVTTAAMALYLLGGLGFIYFQISGYVNEIRDSFQVRVFLKEGLNDAEIGKAKQEIRSMDGVKTVTFVSKEQGLKAFAEKNPNINIEDLKNDNPLPNAFQITVTNITNVPELAADIARKPYVEKNGVQKSDALQSFLEDALYQIRMLGLLIGGLMFVTGGVLIYNAIRLTIMARQREMRIMQLVGASNFTIIMPLLIEGIVQGMLGGLLASLFLHATLLFTNSAITNFAATLTIKPPPLLNSVGWFMLFGAAYGMLCSTIAVRDKRSRAL